MLKQIGKEKWITKFCATGNHWVIATPKHFRVVDDKLVPICKECEAEPAHRHERVAAQERR